jgi:hypothetical protein
MAAAQVIAGDLPVSTATQLLPRYTRQRHGNKEHARRRRRLTLRWKATMHLDIASQGRTTVSRLAAVTALLLALAASAACDAGRITAGSDDGLAFNKGKGGGSNSPIPLKVRWSDAGGVSGDGVLSEVYGAAPDGFSTYVKDDCGVGAHTYTDDGSRAWFDVQPTVYEGECRRHISVDGHLSDLHMIVEAMTSVTTAGSARGVTMAIQTPSVSSATGCDRLVYDASKWPTASTTATVTRLSDEDGKRAWQVSGTRAACVLVNPRNGKESLAQPPSREFDFLFVMTER